MVTLDIEPVAFADFFFFVAEVPINNVTTERNIFDHSNSKKHM